MTSAQALRETGSHIPRFPFSTYLLTPILLSLLWSPEERPPTHLPFHSLSAPSLCDHRLTGNACRSIVQTLSRTRECRHYIDHRYSHSVIPGCSPDDLRVAQRQRLGRGQSPSKRVHCGSVLSHPMEEILVCRQRGLCSTTALGENLVWEGGTTCSESFGVASKRACESGVCA